MSYYDIPAISASALKEADKSMAHFDLFFNHGVTMRATPAMKLGTLVHCMVLEPDEVHERYVVQPDIDKRTKVGKEHWKAFQAEHMGKDIVDAETFCTAENMAEAVKDSPHADLVCGEAEKVIQWVENDLPMKAMCDVFDAFAGRIVDLKTTQDASLDGFSRQAWNLKYHLQAAHYQRAARAVMGDTPGFYFLCVESKPPYCVALYKVAPELCDYGSRLRDNLLVNIKSCMDAGKWPGYEGVYELGLPRWATA